MDPREIFRNDKLLEFWPTARQTAQERVAATSRFVIYASVLVYIINRDSRVFALGILVLAILYYLWGANLIKDGKLRPTQGDGRIPGPFREEVTLPNIENPMGNVLLSDYNDYPDRPSAAWYPSMRQEVAHQWSIIHPFERKRDAERNFYTTASSTIPNDQTAFAQGAYGKPFAPMCKDQGGDSCNPDRPFSHIPERPQMRAGNGR
jgi:hypothetical protein